MSVVAVAAADCGRDEAELVTQARSGTRAGFPRDLATRFLSGLAVEVVVVAAVVLGYIVVVVAAAAVVGTEGVAVAAEEVAAAAEEEAVAAGAAAEAYVTDICENGHCWVQRRQGGRDAPCWPAP